MPATLDSYKRELLLRALEACGQRPAAAAESLLLSTRTFKRLCTRLGVPLNAQGVSEDTQRLCFGSFYANVHAHALETVRLLRAAGRLKREIALELGLSGETVRLLCKKL